LQQRFFEAIDNNDDADEIEMCLTVVWKNEELTSYRNEKSGEKLNTKSKRKDGTAKITSVTAIDVTVPRADRRIIFFGYGHRHYCRFHHCRRIVVATMPTKDDEWKRGWRVNITIIVMLPLLMIMMMTIVIIVV